MTSHLYVSDGRAQDGEVGCFLIVAGGRQLSLQQLKTLFEMSSTVLLELVVDLPGAGARDTAPAPAPAGGGTAH